MFDEKILQRADSDDAERLACFPYIYEYLHWCIAWLTDFGFGSSKQTKLGGGRKNPCLCMHTYTYHVVESKAAAATNRFEMFPGLKPLKNIQRKTTAGAKIPLLSISSVKLNLSRSFCQSETASGRSSEQSNPSRLFPALA